MKEYFIPKSFKKNGYSNLLKMFFDQGYLVRDFLGDRHNSAQLDQKHLILRHDVDMSLDAALTMGVMEEKLDVSATYFILLRSEMYNALTPSSISKIKELMEMKHRIGLHFDTSQYKKDFNSLDKAAQQECDLLENWIGSSIDMISFHRPSKSLLGLDKEFAGRAHTYQSRFFKDMGYCSDSRGSWYNGNPLQNSSIKHKGALQLLTHPIWWHNKHEETVQEVLDIFCKKRTKVIRNELSHNCQTYDSHRSFTQTIKED
jgi:hypothetical protein